MYSYAGFYGLPHKQFWPTPQLNSTQRRWNDKLLPLWKEVTAILPSIYMPYESDCTDAPVKHNTGGCVPRAHNEVSRFWPRNWRESASRRVSLSDSSHVSRLTLGAAVGRHT